MFVAVNDFFEFEHSFIEVIPSCSKKMIIVKQTALTPVFDKIEIGGLESRLLNRYLLM
jgi:hypothetical protein